MDTPHDLWGQYSPFFSVPSDIDPSTPPECDLTFGQVLSRHGSRDPTWRKTNAYDALIYRIQNSVSEYAPGYEFIADYDFPLGKDQLTLFGQREMVESGKAFYQRYKNLADDSDPFFRAAGASRVIESAYNFTHGLLEAQGRSDEIHLPKDMLILPEVRGFNNTLNHGGCPEFESRSFSEIKHEIQDTWKRVWLPPVTERLNRKLPGSKITLDETIYMMDLCPFHTVASPDAVTSDFCRLFSKKEWRNYAYFESLDKWYGYGMGNPLGPTQGVGFANELIARLTGTPVQDETSTNSTLDSSKDTFPLNRTLYADFSHDNLMTSVFAALGLYNATNGLSPTHEESPEQNNGYSAAWTVPFAGRMYVEKMRCSSDDEELVRVLVNDRVVPLHNCGADNLGRCRLGAFVESLSFARNGGLWDACFT
ncbi:histidine phosphatase superfamily [Stachybotrys elegans]|uniref:Phytase A n=1 Tax=Stachybotrys elegans TaxID=80388 RepID=A0A8K0WXK1_9HYPO|nr:histidine phosphatase superfamily [Stachybotrys elegans]